MKTNVQTMVWSALLAAGLMAGVPAAQAQEEGGQKPAREQRQQGPQGQRGDRVQMLREQLGLTDAQVEQLKPIFAAEREEVAAKRRELGGREADREKVREATRAIHESYIPKIEAVLTEEQREKWAKLRERRAGRPGGPGGPGGPGAPKGGGDTE